MCRRRSSAGFTLVELMITIAIAAIGMTLAYPSFTSVLRSNRVATATNSLIASFNLARTEAIRSNSGAGVCPSGDGSACSGNDWNAGVLVFGDNDSTGVWSTGDTAIRYFEAKPALSLAAAPTGGTAAVPAVAFDRRGRVASAIDVVLRPTDCPDNAELQRRVHVSRSGQTRMSKEACQ